MFAEIRNATGECRNFTSGKIYRSAFSSGRIGIEARWEGLKRVADIAFEQHIYLVSDYEKLMLNGKEFPAFIWVGICSRCRETFDEIPLYGVEGKCLVNPSHSQNLICMDCVDKGREKWEIL